MEREVGEEFYSGFYGESYEVCEAELEGTCLGCAFKTRIGCKACSEDTGTCSAIQRTDRKDVIFKKAWREK
jgi:hypothetical protein